MSSDAVAKSVGKKLRYYFEVKRLEDGFDLSGVGNPQLDHPPLKPRATLQYDGLHDKPLKHYFQSPDVKVRLTQMTGTKQPCSSRERRVRRLLDRYITKSKLMAVTIPKSKSGKHPYNSGYSYVQTSKGIKLRADATGYGVPMKSHKKKGIKGACPIIRSVPPHFVSKGEANRLVHVAAKLLVANETVEDLKPAPPNGNKPQSAPAPFETDQSLPHIEVNQRPKTARGFHHNNRGLKYSEDGHEGHEGHDSAYTTQRNSPGSEHSSSKHHHGEGEDRKVKSCWSARSSDSTSESEAQPHPPARGRPSRRNRPMSAKLRRSQVQVTDLSPRHHEEVGVEHSAQTQDSVGIQTEKKLYDEYDYRQKLIPEETEDIVRQGPPVEYQIYVRTGTRIGASTKADVKITLYGEKGRSQEFLLAESQRHKINFQKGKEDLFTIHSPHIGRLSRIKIGHDRTELLYAWFLEGVTVYDMTDKRIYEFPSERWLSGQDGDRRTYRILPMDRDRALIEDSDDGTSTGSDVSYIKRYNEDTDSEEDAKKIDKETKKSSEHLSVKVRQSETKFSGESQTETESETETESDDSGDSEEDEVVVKVEGTAVGRPTQAVEIQTQSEAVGKGANSKDAQQEDQDGTSPGRKHKDDFFDQRPVGPVYTFRSTTSEGSRNETDSEKPNHSITAKHIPESCDPESEAETDRTDKNLSAVIIPKLTALDPIETKPTTAVPADAQAGSKPEMGNSTARTEESSTSRTGTSTSRTATSTSATGNSTSRSDTTVGTEENQNKAVPTRPVPTIAVQEPVEGAVDATGAGAAEHTLSSPRTETDRSTSTSGTATDGNSSSTGSESEREHSTTTVEKTAAKSTEKDEKELSPHTESESSDSESGSESGSKSSGSRSSSEEESDSEDEEDQVKSFAAAQVEQLMEKAEENISATQQSEKAEDNKDTDRHKPEEVADNKAEYAEMVEKVVESTGKEVDEEDKEKVDDVVEDYKKVLQGQTIHEAAQRGNLARIQELLRYYPDMIDQVNEAGWNALHISSSEGHLDMVKWLAGEGLNLNTETPTGYSAIHLAALSGHVNTMMVLSALGAAVCCRTTDRQTPLHLAAMSGHLNCVKWLVANRARVDAKDDFDRTPLELAEEYEHDDVADFLRDCEEEMSDHSSSLTTNTASTKNRYNELASIEEDVQSAHSGREQEGTVPGDQPEQPIFTDNKQGLVTSSTPRKTSSDDEQTDDTPEPESPSRRDEDVEEKRKLYSEQKIKMEESGLSFLDSIRQEYGDS